VQVAFGTRRPHHCFKDYPLPNFNSHSVAVQKREAGRQCGALVAVKEWVILYDVKGIACRQIEQILGVLVVKIIDRSDNGTFQKAFVRCPGRKLVGRFAPAAK
jgi:hypothetical protein